MLTEETHSNSWLNRPIAFFQKLDAEKIIILVILILALFSRFVMAGARVMSHDEVNHVVPSFDLFMGRGYRHDPVTHGPFQFHVVALAFFLLGDNDFAARVPAALFSFAAVAFVLFSFRRYLGRTGTLVGGLLFLISPFMLYYGRYTRNEGFIELFGVVMLYAILRYLDRGDRFSLYMLTLSTVLHFTSKETAFIYTAQLLLFVGLLFLLKMTAARWNDPTSRQRFILIMGLALLLFGLALAFGIWNASLAPNTEVPADTAATPAEEVPAVPWYIPAGEIGALIAAVALGVLGVIILIRKLGWEYIRSQRSFDIMILIGTLILPQLTAFPLKILGMDPLDYSPTGLIRTGAALIIMFVIAGLIGWWWNWKLWLNNAILFYSIFTVLYTTFFTNGMGFFTGIIGSLGYWLSQQSVERGSQPFYYYALVQIPIYEYLAAAGVLLAIYVGARYRLFSQITALEPSDPRQSVEPPEDEDVHVEPGRSLGGETGVERIPVLGLLLFWTFSSLIAYTFAGEKMPWLTVHIALPMLLTGAWAIGYLIDRVPWKRLLEVRGLVAALLLPVFAAAMINLLGSLLGANPPFQGNELVQLQATGSFMLALIGVAASGYGLVYFMQTWETREALSFAAILGFGVLAVLTARSAFMASFVNYDYANEYLVYAHAAPGPKMVLEQVEEISERLTGGKDIVVSYDNDALYPYWWYLRRYPNHRYYVDQPTRDLEDSPLIIAGDSTYSKLDPIVRGKYTHYEYMRLWWPNQDYFNLTWARVWDAIKRPDLRAAVFDIWLNRDFSKYAVATQSETMTAETWQPSARLHLFIRNDVLAQMWDYGAAPVTQTETVTDPYAQALVPLAPDFSLGNPGEMNAPRDVAIASDGSIYISDSRNNRIIHMTSEGEVISAWGEFGNVESNQAQGGTFNEPWGVAVAPDGSVYVADTWNHRVQKFTADGEFVTMWGRFGGAEQQDGFWGPRDVVVGSNGWVYVTDTGNKRVTVYDGDGRFMTQFGTPGMDLGQLDEPVGIALFEDENETTVYVADTWNMRVQAFTRQEDALVFTASGSWNINAWYGQSLENKPYMAMGPDGILYITDPEAGRILKFDRQGTFLGGWSEYSNGADALSLYNGIAIGDNGQAWVVDAANNRVLRFVPGGQ